MPYTFPSKTALKEFILSIRDKYDRQSRKSSACDIAIDRLEPLCQTLDESNADKILVGLLTFYAENNAYAYLHSILNAGPHNHPIPISDKQKLICLDAMAAYVTNRFSLSRGESKTPVDESNKIELKTVVDKITLRLQPQIDDMFRKSRILTIESQIEKLPEEYKKQKAKHPPAYLSTFWAFDYSKEREKYLKLTAIFNNSCMNELLPPTCTTKLSQEHYKYTIRCGFVLYLMKLIPTQQWRFITSEKNSQLYNLCIDIFGTDKIYKVNPTEQKIYISNFRDFIFRAKNNKKIIAALAANGLSKDGQVIRLCDSIISNIDTQFQGVVSPVVKGCIFASAASLSQFVIGIHVGKLAAGIWNAGYGKGLLPALLAEAGDLIGGPAGRAIATYAGTIYEADSMLTIYNKGIWAGIAFSTAFLYESKEAMQARELKAAQEFTIQLDKDVDRIKEGAWQQELSEEIEWITALANFYPEQFKKLAIIREAHHKLTAVEYELKPIEEMVSTSVARPK